MRVLSRVLGSVVFCTMVAAAIAWWSSARIPIAASPGQPAAATLGAPNPARQNPDSCKICMDACNDRRENCRISACQQVGGTPRGSQVCDNIPSQDARNNYNALINACFSTARGCEANCKQSGNCK
jgi:hypothetical protein